MFLNDKRRKLKEALCGYVGFDHKLEEAFSQNVDFERKRRKLKEAPCENVGFEEALRRLYKGFPHGILTKNIGSQEPVVGSG